MLRVRLLGELRLELEGRQLGPIASGRARSLLAWLAYHRGLHPRSRVASVFWPDVLDSSARASLRTTLATLRRELGERRELRRGRARARGSRRGRGGLGRRCQHADGARAVPSRPARGPRRRLGARGAQGGARARRRAARGARRGGRGGRRPGRRRGPRAQAARARSRVRGRRAGADATAGAERGPGGGRGRLRDVPRRPPARAGHGAVGRDARARGASFARSSATRGRTRERCRCRRRSPTARSRRSWAGASRSPCCGPPGAGRAPARRRSSCSSARPGSGKTRLLTELAEEVRATGATVLAGRCVEEGVMAFAPFSEALRPFVAASRGRASRHG